MSADVQLLLHQLRLDRCVLIGHSMGGKTAMVLSLQWVSVRLPRLKHLATGAGNGDRCGGRQACSAVFALLFTNPDYTLRGGSFSRAGLSFGWILLLSQGGICLLQLTCVSCSSPDSLGLLVPSQPELVERLVCVDISPSGTSAVTSFQAFMAAMKAVNIPRGLPRSTARRLAEEQLRSTIQVRPPLRGPVKSQAFPRQSQGSAINKANNEKWGEGPACLGNMKGRNTQVPLSK